MREKAVVVVVVLVLGVALIVGFVVPWFRRQARINEYSSCKSRLDYEHGQIAIALN